MSVLGLVITIFTAILGVIWFKVSAVDDSVNQIKVDIAVIKTTLNIRGQAAILK